MSDHKGENAVLLFILCQYRCIDEILFVPSLNLLYLFRRAASPVRRLRQGVQAQAPLDRAQTTPQRGEALPVLQVSQEVLTQRIVQSAYKPQVQTSSRLREIVTNFSLTLFDQALILPPRGL